MKKIIRRYTAVVLITICYLLPLARSSAQTLSPQVVPTTGGYTTAGGVSLSFTAGETFHATLQRGNIILTQGQQQPVLTIPNAVAVPSQQTVCSGSAITTIALMSNVNGTSYNWTRDNTTTVTGIVANGTGDIAGILTNETGMPVMVTFTIVPKANNDVGAAITATILVNPALAKPIISPAGPITICSNTTVKLTSNTATGNLWSTGATTQSIKVKTTGNYTVTVTNSKGCTATSDPVQVTATPAQTYFADSDGDSYGNAAVSLKACAVPAGYVKNSRDCNDADAAIHPGAAEICGNGIDDDCDGLTDEGCSLPVVKINDVSVQEGNSKSQNITFNVTLSKASAQTVTVNFATANGTATAPSDYAAKTGIVTFAPGVKKRTIAISVKGDVSMESDENFSVVLSNATGATIGDNTGVCTIINDDGTTLLAKSTGSNSNAPSMSISPNPASSIIAVQLKGYRGAVTLQLTDLAGKVLGEKKLSADNLKYIYQQFNIADIASGTYLVVASDEHGHQQSRSVIVAH